jgi:uncharacterized protein DUF6159
VYEATAGVLHHAMSVRPVMEPTPQPPGPGPAGSGASRWSRAWDLLRTGWPAVRDNRSMLWLAAASTLLSIVVGALAVVYAYDIEQHHHKLHLAIAGAVLAFPARVVATFFGVAMCRCAMTYFDGGRCTATSAVRSAWRLRGPIVGWALLAAIVGLVIEQVAQRVPFLGRLAAWLGEVAWAAVSFFAAAVIAVHGTGPRETVRRAGAALRERWGEGVAGVITVNAALWVVTVPAMFLCLVGLASIDGGHVVPGVLLTGLGVAAVAGAFALGEAVEQTFALALLRFAETGQASGPFQAPDFRAALERGPRRRWWRRGT